MEWSVYALPRTIRTNVQRNNHCNLDGRVYRLPENENFPVIEPFMGSSKEGRDEGIQKMGIYKKSIDIPRHFDVDTAPDTTNRHPPVWIHWFLYST